jgi:(p)ppGpp synthase/HD superfamily hydrolase
MEDIKSWESKFQPCEYSDKLLNLITELNKTARVPVNILEIKKACYYAREYHGTQLRKSGDPYYSHPLIVAYLFAKYVAENAQRYYTTDLIVIAILHDTIEDTTLTSDMIQRIFNQSVAIGVEDLTRLKYEIKTTAADTLNSLFVQYKLDILHIKVFDRVHNMRTICAMKPEKQKKIIDETVSHFIPMTSYLGLYKIKQELITLCDGHSKTKQDPPFDDNQSIFNQPQFFSPSLQSVIDRIHNQ